VQIVRFAPQMLKAGTRTRLIAGVSVNIYKPAKTVADLFHHAFHHAWRQGRDGPKADVTAALQAMKEDLRLGKATPAEIARYAEQAGIWSKVQPYLEAMTVEGWAGRRVGGAVRGPCGILQGAQSAPLTCR
jgi:hypothetical protein